MQSVKCKVLSFNSFDSFSPFRATPKVYIYNNVWRIALSLKFDKDDIAE